MPEPAQSEGWSPGPFSRRLRYTAQNRASSAAATARPQTTAKRRSGKPVSGASQFDHTTNRCGGTGFRPVKGLWPCECLSTGMKIFIAVSIYRSGRPGPGHARPNHSNDRYDNGPKQQCIRRRPENDRRHGDPNHQFDLYPNGTTSTTNTSASATKAKVKHGKVVKSKTQQNSSSSTQTTP